MRSALLPLSIQGGCCRSREPTVWNQLIAGSVFARRASRIELANLLQRSGRVILWPTNTGGTQWLRPRNKTWTPNRNPYITGLSQDHILIQSYKYRSIRLVAHFWQ